MRFLGLLILLFAFPLSPARAQSFPAELHSFWRTPGEHSALDVLVQAAKDVNVDLRLVYHDSYNDLRGEVGQRVGTGYPPELSHWIGGENLETFILSGDLALIQHPETTESMRSVVRAEVIEQVSINDAIYAIPIGIHVWNNAVYNLDVLGKVGVDEFPTDWETLFAVMDKLEDAGLSSFSGSTYNWLVEQNFFGVLSTVGGNAAVDAMLFDSQTTSELEAALERTALIMEKLRLASLRTGRSDRWNETVARVVNGEAAFTFVGDYAWSEFVYDRPDSLESFGCAPMPEAKHAYFGVDLFIPFDTKNTQWNELFPLLLEKFHSPKVQAAYVARKGGLPVIDSIELESLNRCSASGERFWRDATLFSTGSARDNERVSAVRKVLERYWLQESISVDQLPDELLATTIIKNYAGDK